MGPRVETRRGAGVAGTFRGSDGKGRGGKAHGTSQHRRCTLVVE
jgi:hypothetical protein